jgi:hypothetical protein
MSNDFVVPYDGWPQFAWVWNQDHHFVTIPHWLAALVTAGLSVLLADPRFKWRFSLRTLLIAVTLVATGMGLFVYFAKQ